VYIKYAMKKLALIVLVALALPATALAKGPSHAAIAGAGLTTIRISGAEGSATPFWRLVEEAGWFEAAWGPSRLPQAPPQGELGPKYTITWKVPSSNKLYQDVYPYAKPYPVTYMPSGQKIYDTPVKGGWFQGGAKLKSALARVGLPTQAPQASAPAAHAPPPPSQPGSDVWTGAITAIAAGAVILALALLLGIRARRRPRRTNAA
jgi:hypothetical protein